MKTKIRETDFYKWIGFEGNKGVEISIDKENKLMNQKHTVRINWSCFGSVTIKRTEEFIKTLQEAVKLAKKEKKSNG